MDRTSPSGVSRRSRPSGPQFFSVNLIVSLSVSIVGTSRWSRLALLGLPSLMATIHPSGRRRRILLLLSGNPSCNPKKYLPPRLYGGLRSVESLGRSGCPSKQSSQSVGFSGETGRDKDDRSAVAQPASFRTRRFTLPGISPRSYFILNA
jgi:hypothetical protein